MRQSRDKHSYIGTGGAQLNAGMTAQHSTAQLACPTEESCRTPGHTLQDRNADRLRCHRVQTTTQTDWSAQYSME